VGSGRAKHAMLPTEHASAVGSTNGNGHTVQRAAPFGYVAPRGPHWNGSDRDSGPNRVKVDITTLPTQLVTFGSPDEHFDLGFLTFGTPDGYPTSIRIDHNPQLALPALMRGLHGTYAASSVVTITVSS